MWHKSDTLFKTYFFSRPQTPYLYEKENLVLKKKHKKVMNCFGDYRKTSIFAPAIEK